MIPATYHEAGREMTLDESLSTLPENHLARQQLAGIRANLAKRGKHDGTGPNLDPWIQIAQLRAENAALRRSLGHKFL